MIMMKLKAIQMIIQEMRNWKKWEAKETQCTKNGETRNWVISSLSLKILLTDRFTFLVLNKIKVA